MKKQTIRTIYSVTLVLLDAVMVVAGFYLAYRLRTRFPWPDEFILLAGFRASYVGILGVQLASILVTMFAYRQYYLPRSLSRIDLSYRTVLGVTVGMFVSVSMVQLLLRNSRFDTEYTRVMILYAWMITMVLVIIGRLIHSTIRDLLRRRGVGSDRLIIVGDSETARITAQKVDWTPKLGYELVGIVANQQKQKRMFGHEVLGTPEEIADIVDKYNIDEVIIAMPERGHREVLKVLSHCERGRVSIKVFPDVFQSITTSSSIDDLGGLPLLTVRDFAMRGYMLVVKRLMDFFGALFGLIILSPLMLLVAIAIKLESRGPAFFVQERMGLDGRSIQVLKFRSMRTDAEVDGPGWSVKDDPRKTRIGKFLRRIDIDELPQLINVLIGEMSLVGPRPEQPHYVAEFRKSIPNYMDRHREKAGITGWAQVNGLRGDTSIDERTRYDLWYAENWSLWLDIQILVRTVWKELIADNDGGS